MSGYKQSVAILVLLCLALFTNCQTGSPLKAALISAQLTGASHAGMEGCFWSSASNACVWAGPQTAENYARCTPRSQSNCWD